MKISFLVLTLLFSVPAFAAEQMFIAFSKQQIKQGSIEDAVVELNIEAAQNPELSQIKNLNLAGTFYIYNAKPFFRKEGEGTLKTEAKVVLLKIPEANPLNHKLSNSSLTISWNNVQFIPTEEAKGLIFGTFEVPERKKLMKWGLIILTILVLSVAGFIFYRKYKAKTVLKRRKAELKDSLISARSYEEVVEVWKKKQHALKEFPKLEQPYQKLEQVLFKYQFKPTQTESEKTEVMKAYKDFIQQSQGGFDGI